MTKNPGSQLRAIREAREISLEEISQKTHIRLEYLEALENGDTDQLPEGPQRRGFLRLYASELGVAVDSTEIKEVELAPEFEEGSPSTIKSKEVESLDETLDELVKDKTSSISTETTSLELQENLLEMEASQPSPAGAQQIFADLGRTLRQRRELLSLSIEDIHEHIHIRKNFLIAMENGDFSQLPSTVQARGMLANYADFLDLDADAILLQYADGLQVRRLEKAEVSTPQVSEDAKTLSKTRLRLKNFFSVDLLVIAALIIGFAAFVIWGVNRILRVNESGGSPTDLPQVADILLATGSPTPLGSTTPDEMDTGQDQTGTPAPEEATPIFTPLPNDSPINIVIIPRQRAWVRVISDGETVFEGRMLPGDAYDFTGEENLELLTGSAGALQILFNEQDIGSPGLIGQVANLIFTESGLILPTPTSTATITETPEASLTPTPSLTPSQTLQPTATPTEPND